MCAYISYIVEYEIIIYNSDPLEMLTQVWDPQILQIYRKWFL